MPPKKMEAKVAALENEVASLQTTLTAMQMKVDSNQEQLLAMLTQSLQSQRSRVKKKAKEAVETRIKEERGRRKR